MQTRHTRMLPFSRSVMSDSLQPRGRQPARLLCPRGSPGKNTGMGCHASSRDLPDPGIEPTSPALAAGFFTTEPPGKGEKNCLQSKASQDFSPDLDLFSARCVTIPLFFVIHWYLEFLPFMVRKKKNPNLYLMMCLLVAQLCPTLL